MLQTVDLSATLAALQQAGNAVGQAVVPTLHAGAAELQALAAPAVASARLVEVAAAKKLVRAVGVDSNAAGSDTPASRNGDAHWICPLHATSLLKAQHCRSPTDLHTRASCCEACAGWCPGAQIAQVGLLSYQCTQLMCLLNNRVLW